MDIFLTEQQQIEQIRQWWKKNGKWLFAFLLAFILLSVAWQVWHHHREKDLMHASNHYEWLIDGVMSNNPLVVQAQSRYILSRYPHTPYALMAAFMQARQAINENDLPRAEEKLLWVVEHASNASVKQVARLRAARVLLAQAQQDKALDLLKKVDDASYYPLIESLRGDIYLAMGKRKQAKEAYENAVSHLSDQDAIQPFLQMKLDDIA